MAHTHSGHRQGVLLFELVSLLDSAAPTETLWPAKPFMEKVYQPLVSIMDLGQAA